MTMDHLKDPNQLGALNGGGGLETTLDQVEPGTVLMDNRRARLS